MHFSSPISVAIAGLAVLAKADFQIYLVDIFNIEQGVTEHTFVFGGEPDCNDVGNAIPISVTDDASSGGTRYKIADTAVPIADYDIEELELNIDGWGHYTIYKDRGYVLEEASGGPNGGTCTRDSGDDFTCTTNIQTATGMRVFTCSSELGGV
ncbi:hypothetical protein CKM354_000474000 [Cercospora kikuchii]|uniref:Uncharacterized protein n=1 Tax=Cercospora kikuchii TaxID=84275 RepID=A0A9P3CGE3_9PEZI|nr:uncharacterized protein CKM354_000474000 [Cercospora kikuchii]GIZ41436.1 hypothetical protein CKM354_000474000 [Cercospora kikuchii]